VLLTGPAHGSLTLNPDGSFRYTPASNFVGNDSFTYQAKGSNGALSPAAVVSLHVLYNFSGFAAPLNGNLAFALNRTVPIKFQLTDAKGAFISGLSAVTSLQVLNSQGQNILTNAGATALRYDSSANQFVANWSSKGLPAGSYTITLTLADGSVYKKKVQLSGNGTAGALLVDGSTVTATVGVLLGGDVELYVDNSNGELTADELARIQDAVTAADAVTEPYGVAVQEVSDPTQADVTLNMDTTSAVGGYAEGVLGCTTDAGQITIINGWNFYAGSEATQIGSGQYDFQTVVTHELGHALGLGHSTDSTSVMYATLAAGTVNRSLTTADLNVPDADTTGACGLHAAVAQPPTPTSFGSGTAAAANRIGALVQSPAPVSGAGWEARPTIPSSSANAAGPEDDLRSRAVLGLLAAAGSAPDSAPFNRPVDGVAPVIWPAAAAGVGPANLPTALAAWFAQPALSGADLSPGGSAPPADDAPVPSAPADPLLPEGPEPDGQPTTCPALPSGSAEWRAEPSAATVDGFFLAMARCAGGLIPPGTNAGQADRPAPRDATLGGHLLFALLGAAWAARDEEAESRRARRPRHG
jgi:hypothetical protein